MSWFFHLQIFIFLYFSLLNIVTYSDFNHHYSNSHIWITLTTMICLKYRPQMPMNTTSKSNICRRYDTIQWVEAFENVHHLLYTRQTCLSINHLFGKMGNNYQIYHQRTTIWSWGRTRLHSGRQSIVSVYTYQSVQTKGLSSIHYWVWSACHNNGIK